MAGTIGKTTRVTERAGTNIMKALERAKSSLADIPLGEVKYDPRTMKKREQEQQLDPGMDSSLVRILHDIRTNTNG